MAAGTGRRLRARRKQNYAGNLGTQTRAAGPPVDGKPSLGQRARYGFDATMSRGSTSLILWLAAISAVMVLVFTVLVIVGRLSPQDDNGHRHGFIGQLFVIFEHSIDTGTISGDSGSWTFLAAMLVLTLGGLFIVSALIGVIATALDEKLLELRKGRSFVIETDHTLVLGWSDSVFTICSELAVANESRRRPSVVILADKDKVEMEDAIREKVGGRLGNTRVICRTGEPIDPDDLAIVNPGKARSVVILSPLDDPEPDAQVIKTMLALTQGDVSLAEHAHIVAEIQDPENMETARLVGGDDAVIIDRRETIARLIVQTSRQSGAAAVYTELLDFDGEEIYFRGDENLTGKTYAQLLLAYENAAVLGVQTVAGEVLLNPPMDRVLAAGERVIAVAEDDSALDNAVPYGGSVDESLITGHTRTPDGPKRTLLLGWNSRASTVVRELDAFTAPGSHLTVVSEWEPTAAVIAEECPDLEHMTVDVRVANTANRKVLAALDAASYDHVIVLCYSDLFDAQRADARTLITLLHLRDLGDQDGNHLAIASEMIDSRNSQLAQVTEVDDVIVSDQILSLVLTQLAENADLYDVFAQLFTAEGSEVYLRPIEEYVELDREVDIATIVTAASRRDESAIGLRVAAFAHDAGAGYGVTLNPAKSHRITPCAGDMVVVLAED